MRRFLEPHGDLDSPVDDTRVQLGAPGELLVRTRAGVTLRAQITDGPDDSEVELWVVPGWLVAVAVEGHRVVSCDLEAGTIVSLPGLARLDLPGYDPGGLLRVDFHGLEDARRVLVETEVAVACIDPTSIVWQRVHGDATCRVGPVERDLVPVMCEYSSISLRLEDGTELLD